MLRISVESTAIESIGYDAKSKTLEIEFSSGAVWQYFDVPEGIYKMMKKAESKGRFFGDEIRGMYEEERIR